MRNLQFYVSGKRPMGEDIDLILVSNCSRFNHARSIFWPEWYSQSVRQCHLASVSFYDMHVSCYKIMKLLSPQRSHLDQMIYNWWLTQCLRNLDSLNVKCFPNSSCWCSLYDMIKYIQMYGLLLSGRNETWSIIRNTERHGTSGITLHIPQC